MLYPLIRDVFHLFLKILTLEDLIFMYVNAADENRRRINGFHTQKFSFSLPCTTSVIFGARALA